MKIGGGNYEEEDIIEAKAATRVIFQKIEEGKVMNAGRMVEVDFGQMEVEMVETAIGKMKAKAKAMPLPEYYPPGVGANESEAIDQAANPATQMACNATSHRWSEPTTAPVTVTRTSVICKECSLVLATEKQGTASEVMAELLKQIPH